MERKTLTKNAVSAAMYGADQVAMKDTKTVSKGDAALEMAQQQAVREAALDDEEDAEKARMDASEKRMAKNVKRQQKQRREYVDGESHPRVEKTDNELANMVNQLSDAAAHPGEGVRVKEHPDEERNPFVGPQEKHGREEEQEDFESDAADEDDMEAPSAEKAMEANVSTTESRLEKMRALTDRLDAGSREAAAEKQAMADWEQER